MILYRYITREFIRPFVYSLLTIVMMFFMQLAARLLPRVLYRGISVDVILELFAVHMASIVVLSVPMALLISSLMVFGKLSADNEFTAIKAAGYSLSSLLPPVISLSGIVAVTLLFFNNTVLPEANHHASQLMYDIMRKKPAALIEPGILVRDFPGYAIMVDSVTAGTGNLYGITVFTSEKSGTPVVTVADSGTLYLTPDEQFLEMTLSSGEIVNESGEDAGAFYRIAFQRQIIYVENIDSELTRSDRSQRGDREKSTEQLLEDVRAFTEAKDLQTTRHNQRIEDIQTMMGEAIVDTNAVPYLQNFDEWYSTIQRSLGRNVQGLVKREQQLVSTRIDRIEKEDKKINKFMVEVYKKYSLAVAAIIFALLGVPLGILARNGTVAISVSYSLAFFLLYWAFLIAGEHLGDSGYIPPILGMWSGNILLGFLSIYLIFRATKEEQFINWFFIRKILQTPFLPLIRFFKKQPCHNSANEQVRHYRKPFLQGLSQIPNRLLRLLMSTLPSYIVGRFFSYFFVVTIGIVLLTVVIDYVSNIALFDKATPKELVRYYAYLTLSFLTIIMPISMLLSTMLSVGSFSKTNELTAVKASGVSMVKMTLPLVFFGILMSVGNFWFTESVLPETNRDLELLKNIFEARRDKRPVPTEVKSYKRDFYYFSESQKTAYFFAHFQTFPPRGDGIVRYEFDNKRRVSSITKASRMLYDEKTKKWTLHSGMERKILNSGISFRRFSQEDAQELKQTPQDMVKQIKRVEQMSYTELSQYMDTARKRGENVRKYESDLNFKFALPLMNLVCVLMGVAVTARATKRGGAVSFGAGLGLVFLYWVAAQFFLVFGRNESIHPLIAAWSATVVFLIFGFYLYGKVSR